MTRTPFLVTADHLERIAYHNPGAEIEFHDGFGYLTAGSITYRTIARVGGAA